VPLPPLGPGSVHLWCAELADERAQELVELLSPQERARAAQILGDRGRALWMRAHGVLRCLLAGYMGLDARALRFSAGVHGKPCVLVGGGAGKGSKAQRSAGPRAGASVAFNISHAGSLALLGFTAAGAIGVDVEALSERLRDEVAIAKRLLGVAEAERLGSLEPAHRRQEFLRIWTHHEARAKLAGSGLGLERQPQPAMRSPGKPRSPRQAPHSREPWLADLDVGPGRAASVALEQAPVELHCWSWTSPRLVRF
jgi:4'-phosphopantetheinyl transferase